MFKVGDYVDYKGEILEVVAITKEGLVLREPHGDMFGEYMCEILAIAKIEDCKSLPF